MSKKEYMKKYRLRNIIRDHAYAKKYREKFRNSFFEMYGKECVCCHEKQIEFLTIDHIKHFEKDKWETGYKAYRKAMQEYRPDLYQVLCYNCNCARGRGICPHQIGK